MKAPGARQPYGVRARTRCRSGGRSEWRGGCASRAGVGGFQCHDRPRSPSHDREPGESCDGARAARIPSVTERVASPACVRTRLARKSAQAARQTDPLHRASAVLNRGEKAASSAQRRRQDHHLPHDRREEQPDDRNVAIDRGVTTIGYFSQDVGEMAGKSGRRDHGRRRPGLETARSCADRARLADPDRRRRDGGAARAFGHAQARFEELGGYALEARGREILAGLGFAPEVVDGDVGASPAAGRCASRSRASSS